MPYYSWCPNPNHISSLTLIKFYFDFLYLNFPVSPHSSIRSLCLILRNLRCSLEIEITRTSVKSRKPAECCVTLIPLCVCIIMSNICLYIYVYVYDIEIDIYNKRTKFWPCFRGHFEEQRIRRILLRRCCSFFDLSKTAFRLKMMKILKISKNRQKWRF